MKAYFNQLSSLLRKDLSNFYLITGDEPLQKMEAVDMIRNAVYKAGYSGRELFFVDKDFDWGALAMNTSNASLFGDKRFLDIRLYTDKVNAAGADFFKSILEVNDPDCLYLVQAKKVDGRSAWVKKFMNQGVCITVYPKSLSDMKSWLRERALRKGLKVDIGVVDIIAEYSEGNMLAAAQELDKIALSATKDNHIISIEEVQEIIGNSAHYTAWNLADAVIAGEADRALRVFHGLQSEAAPMPLVLWAIADQFRQMEDITNRIQDGSSIDAVLKPVWKTRQATYRKAISRQLNSNTWNILLHSCHQVDRTSKGYGIDGDWNELLRVVMRALRLPPLNRPPMAYTQA